MAVFKTMTYLLTYFLSLSVFPFLSFQELYKLIHFLSLQHDSGVLVLSKIQKGCSVLSFQLNIAVTCGQTAWKVSLGLKKMARVCVILNKLLVFHVLLLNLQTLTLAWQVKWAQGREGELLNPVKGICINPAVSTVPNMEQLNTSPLTLGIRNQMARCHS